MRERSRDNAGEGGLLPVPNGICLQMPLDETFFPCLPSAPSAGFVSAVSLVLDVGLGLLAAGKRATILSAFASHCATEITHIAKEAPSKEGSSRPGPQIFDLELCNNALSIKRW